MQGLSPVPPRAAATIVIDPSRPCYRLETSCYFDDELIEAGQIIYWSDEPNQFMTPLNDLAFERLHKHLERLDAKGREVAEKNGFSYTGLADAMNQAREMAVKEGKRGELVSAKEQPQILGKKRGRPKAQRLEGELSAEPRATFGGGESKTVQAARNMV